jgi:hypothetical protein
VDARPSALVKGFLGGEGLREVGDRPLCAEALEPGSQSMRFAKRRQALERFSMRPISMWSVPTL